ncbi:MAG: transglutaminase family protein [Bacteroidota bacterium]
MRYTIQHITRFQYDRPVRESVTELRMQPRSEGKQLCVNFSISVQPHVAVSSYQDFMLNTVHHFDIPALHTELLLQADATVEVMPFSTLPDALPAISWDALDGEARDIHWDYVNPSDFAQSTPLLLTMAKELKLGRLADPLTTLIKLNKSIYEGFDYAPQSTHVESRIDEALKVRRGVCQDFTHIMITLGRMVGIPCRYVSGYLFHRNEDEDRSAEDATHAWMEAWLPELGWIGFDPTNNLIAGERHIRVAIGRDYADVPPTRGTFKGDATERLGVGVRVALSDYQEKPGEILLNETPMKPREAFNGRAKQQAAMQQQ